MTVIKIKNSSQPGKIPSDSDLEIAELGLNLADRRLYSKDTLGQIFEIGAGGDVPSGGGSDRPDNPTLGDLFYDTDLELLLFWNGTEWEPVGGATVAIGDTPPITPAPKPGDLWFDTASGQLYIYYTDSDSSQWIPTATGGGGGSGGDGGSTVYVSATPPVGDDVYANSLWYDTMSGKMFVYIPNTSGDYVWVQLD